METPNREAPMNRRSGMEFFFTAAIMPQTIPSVHANNAARSARIRVLTKAEAIKEKTGLPNE